MADKEHNDILDYFPEDHEGRNSFKKDDVVIVAKVFNDKLESQVAASLLRTRNIPHFLADSNATLFTENVLGGERLFIRKEDLEEVSEILEGIRENQFEGEEDWYKEVKTQEGYKPYQKLTFVFVFALVAFFIFVMILIFTIY